MIKQIGSVILKGKRLQEFLLTSETSSKRAIVQQSNHLKQIAEQNGIASLSSVQLGSQNSMFVMLQKRLLKPNKYFNYKYKSSQYQTFINPKVLDYSVNQVQSWQQCPSYPNLKFLIKRSTHIIVEYEKSFKDRQPIKQQLSGFESILFQHQVTHLKCNNLFDFAQEVQLTANLNNHQLQQQLTQLSHKSHTSHQSHQSHQSHESRKSTEQKLKQLFSKFKQQREQKRRQRLMKIRQQQQSGNSFNSNSNSVIVNANTITDSNSINQQRNSSNIKQKQKQKQKQNDQSYQQNQQQYRYKHCKPLRNFVQYQICDPV